MKSNGFSDKKLLYKVVGLNGKELMKFYNRKVALSYAIDNDAVIIHYSTYRKMRRSEQYHN